MFQSYSLHVSIVGFLFTIRQKRIRGGVCSLKVTARHLNNADRCYEYTIVSVPRIARRYTIHCSLPNTHTVHIELDGGSQAGREAEKERGRMEDGREGARGGWDGGWEQGNTREGGRGGGEEGGRERVGREGVKERGREGARVGREGRG